MADLPIDIVDPNKRPPRFRWKQTVDTIAGRRTITNEGVFPPGIEEPVAALIALAKAQAQEIAALRRQVEGHADRIAAQSDLLSKKAEAQPQKKGKV